MSAPPNWPQGARAAGVLVESYPVVFAQAHYVHAFAKPYPGPWDCGALPWMFFRDRRWNPGGQFWDRD